MKKNQVLNQLMKTITEKHLKTVVDKASTMTHKPITYNAALDENDYAEYIAKKQGVLAHINNKKNN